MNYYSILLELFEETTKRQQRELRNSIQQQTNELLANSTKIIELRNGEEVRYKTEKELEDKLNKLGYILKDKSIYSKKDYNTLQEYKAKEKAREKHEKEELAKAKAGEAEDIRKGTRKERVVTKYVVGDKEFKTKKEYDDYIKKTK